MFPLPDTEALLPALRAEVLQRNGLHVYRMVMHSPGIAPAFLGISDALRHANSLPPTWRELAILRVGNRYGAAYELHHHERMARASGLSEQAIGAARVGADTQALPDAERQTLSLTDELLDQHGLSPASRSQALTWLSVNQLTDLVLLVGFYQLVCNFLNTFEVEPEA